MSVHLIFTWYDRTTDPAGFAHERRVGPIPRVGEGVVLDGHDHGVVFVSYDYSAAEPPLVTVQLSDRLKP